MTRCDIGAFEFVPGPGPAVASVQVQTTGRTVTAIQLIVTESLDRATVENLANYQLLTLGKRGQSKSVQLRAAACDSDECRAVTLTPKKPLKPNKTYQLIASGTPGSPHLLATGLRSQDGALLNGDGDAVQGGNLVAAIGAESASPRHADIGNGAMHAARSAAAAMHAATPAMSALAIDVVLADEHATDSSLLQSLAESFAEH